MGNTLRRTRANARQIAEVRLELHRAVDHVCDAWPQIEGNANARPFARGGIEADGRRQGGTHSDPTGSLAIRVDPSTTWLSLVAETRLHLQALVKAAAEMTATSGLVVCAGCRSVIDNGNLKRHNGRPYHITGGCYQAAWRQGNESAGS